MRRALLFPILILLTSSIAFAQAALQPEGRPPALKEVRKTMGIASKGEVRGQQDAVGFASKREQMAKVWELSSKPPAPELLGDAPKPGVVGVICPHDDYLYAGRVYRQVLPLVTAKTVIMVGVFHKYRRFGAHDVLVFDNYHDWRTPDGALVISALRDVIVAQLPRNDFVRDDAAHDSEHSLEALAYWLKHANPRLQIIPIIVPATGFGRMQELADRLSAAIAEVMKKYRLQLGRDVAIAISSDAVHYGADFKYTPYGDGGVEAYVKACDQDRALLRGPLTGEVADEKIRSFYATCVNPEQPSEYKLTWCGRFSIPFGMMVIERTARALGLAPAVGHLIAYATSVGAPELPVRDIGMGETAPANLYHFVGYPAVAFTVGP